MYQTTSCKPVPLSDIDKMTTKTFITIKDKVRSLKKPICKGLNCQEITVADHSGAARLSVWENKINREKVTVLKMCLCMNTLG